MEIKTVMGKVTGHNEIEVEGELLYAVPMNYVQMSNFIGDTCFLELQKSGPGYLVTQILKIEL